MFSFVTTTLGSTPQTYFQVVPGISKASSGYDSCLNGNGTISGNGALNYVDCQPVANAWRATGADHCRCCNAYIVCFAARTVYGFSCSNKSFDQLRLSWILKIHSFVPILTDNGTWWLRDTPYGEPNGDYGSYCFLAMWSWNLPILTFNDATCGYASGNNYLCSTNDFNNVPVIPPSTDGLVGLYTADSWNGMRWSDLSGSGNHVTKFGGTITKSTSGFNGRTYIYGNTTARLIWPAAILPSTYTLFHVAKYNNGARGRIFSGNSGNNWLSGFNLGCAGVAYHDGLLNAAYTDCCGFNWVVSTDQKGLYR